MLAGWPRASLSPLRAAPRGLDRPLASVASQALTSPDQSLAQTHSPSPPRRYLNGRHYSRTLEAWLRLHDAARPAIMPLFEATYGGTAAGRAWFARWRLFYLACSELFAFEGCAP